MDIDIQGTQTVIRAAIDAGVRRFFYVSHLGSDRASAFPLLKAKAIAEEYIRRSGLDYTILVRPWFLALTITSLPAWHG
jgi:NADH dehydrogenase